MGSSWRGKPDMRAWFQLFCQSLEHVLLNASLRRYGLSIARIPLYTAHHKRIDALCGPFTHDALFPSEPLPFLHRHPLDQILLSFQSARFLYLDSWI